MKKILYLIPKYLKLASITSLYRFTLILTHVGMLLKKLRKKAKEKLPNWPTGPLRKTWEKLKRKGPEFLSDPEFLPFIKGLIKSKIQGLFKEYIENFLKGLFKGLELPEKLKKFWREFLEWIAAIDPVSSQSSSTYV